MEYNIIIIASLLVVISFVFNIVAKRTNIPSVLLLIVTGVLLQYVMVWMDMGNSLQRVISDFDILPLLGTVGLIMIVLEAALDLRLTKEKVPLILRTFVIALLGLLASAFAATGIIQLFLPDMSFMQALLYSIPLSILSSAIVIPSVENLDEYTREFHIYESTFSDILGIMFFYFMEGLMTADAGQGNAVSGFLISTGITIAISLIASYVLIYLFQNIESHVKLFLLIAILLLLYAVGKMFHLSSLLLILVFGLVLSNYKLFFPGQLRKTLKEDNVKNILKDFHVVTIETAFIVRTFFFLIFGLTIAVSSLFSIQVALISILILVTIYAIRFGLFKMFTKGPITPQIYIAPRGLITVLLFFGISTELQYAPFPKGVLLFIILATGVVMTWALIKNSKKELEDEILEEMKEEAVVELEGEEDSSEITSDNHEETGGGIGDESDSKQG